jgi:hypothetical protein
MELPRINKVPIISFVVSISPKNTQPSNMATIGGNIAT